jgi:hypothetical protein
VVVDGRPLAAYVGAYATNGRVFAPVAPLLTGLADRVWSDGEQLTIERNGRQVRVTLTPPLLRGQLNAVYVPVGPVLRALGATVRYEPKAHRLLVFTPPRAIVATPTPFNAAIPTAAPSTVFTPIPPATPRPIWTGSPLPRRTALPFPPPQLSGTSTTLPAMPRSTHS